MTHDDPPTSHKGKIGSLPSDIRAEVNRRLDDGETQQSICDWLNQQEPVLAILDERWNEQPVTPQNLSEWRKGGYQAHRRQLERTRHLQTLSEWAVDMADKIRGANLVNASQTIIAGHLLESVEAMESGEALDLTEALADLNLSVERSRKNDIAETKAEISQRQVEHREKELQLSREKFETQTVEKFLKWQGTKEAQAIVQSNEPKHVQTEKLRELFFGPLGDDADE